MKIARKKAAGIPPAFNKLELLENNRLNLPFKYYYGFKLLTRVNQIKPDMAIVLKSRKITVGFVTIFDDLFLLENSDGEIEEIFYKRDVQWFGQIKYRLEETGKIHDDGTAEYQLIDLEVKRSLS